MVFTLVFDIDTNLLNFLTFKSLKNLIHISGYEYRLIHSSFNSQDLTKIETDYIYKCGNLKIIKIMLNDTKYTVGKLQFEHLCKNGHLKVIKLLGRIFKKICNQNSSAMSAAAEGGHLSIVKYLYNRGVKLDKSNKCALIAAAANGYLNIVKYLKKKGANLSTNFNRAIEIAFENGHLAIVKYLYKQQRSVNGIYLLKAAENGYLEVIKFFNETIIQNIDNRGKLKIMFKDILYIINKAVRLATKSGHLEIVEYLHDNFSIDVCYKNNKAIRIAAKYGHIYLVKYFVKHGADVTARNNAAVRYAAKYGYLNIVKYLMNKGADIHAKNDWSLAKASMIGDYRTIKYLIECGADVSARKNEAITKAQEYGHKHIVNLLTENGAVLPIDKDNKIEITNNALSKKFCIKWEKFKEKEKRKIVNNYQVADEFTPINNKYNYIDVNGDKDYDSDHSYHQYHSCYQSENEDSDDDWMDGIELRHNNNCLCQYDSYDSHYYNGGEDDYYGGRVNIDSDSYSSIDFL